MLTLHDSTVPKDAAKESMWASLHRIIDRLDEAKSSLLAQRQRADEAERERDERIPAENMRRIKAERDEAEQAGIRAHRRLEQAEAKVRELEGERDKAKAAHNRDFSRCMVEMDRLQRALRGVIHESMSDPPLSQSDINLIAREALSPDPQGER